MLRKLFIQTMAMLLTASMLFAEVIPVVGSTGTVRFDEHQQQWTTDPVSTEDYGNPVNKNIYQKYDRLNASKGEMQLFTDKQGEEQPFCFLKGADGVLRPLYEPEVSDENIYNRPITDGTHKHFIKTPDNKVQQLVAGPGGVCAIKDDKNHFLPFTAYPETIQFVSDEQMAEDGSQVVLSQIEQAMQDTANAETKPAPQKVVKDKILTQFGYDFFKPDARGFAPLTDIPVGNDYILGAGDQLNISIWGSIDGRFDLEVNQNGDLVIPKVGTVPVSGVAYGDLPALLRSHIGRIYKDFKLSVTMNRMRLIKVYLVGQVSKPGDYQVPGASTVLTALAAGGGPTKNGSMRKIEIKRNGKLVDTVDLYDFFLKGDKVRDIRLLPGDTIFVPSIGPVAAISGNVRRPAIYELKDNENNSLKDLISLADGIIATGYLQRLQMTRVEAFDKKIVTDINLDPKSTGKSIEEITAGVRVKDQDLVQVFPIDKSLRGYVRLEGYVLRPGDYEMKPDLRVADVLAKDNLLPEHYTAAGQIVRIVPPDFHPELHYFNVKQAMEGDPEQNIKLQEMDIIRIFSRWEMEEMPQVRISGEVQKPGIYRLFGNMKVRDLLVFAGNTKMTAFLQNAEISRTKIDGNSVTSYPIVINLQQALAGDPQHNVALEPFDELYIRKIPNWSEETDRYVTLKGEFVYPGVYPIYRGERLSSVIARAGGFTDRAYTRAAKFTRRSVQIEQQKRMNEALNRAEREIEQKQGQLASASASRDELASTQASLDSLSKAVEKMRQLKAEGRVVIRIESPEKLRNTDYDLMLEGAETLEVPQHPGVVHVLGEVYNQTSFVYKPETARVNELLNMAGGPTRNAEVADIYLIRADGSVESRQQASFGFSWNKETRSWGFGGFMSTPVYEGDTIIVPQKLEKTAWMRDIKDITQILANVAMAAGSVYLWFK